MLGNKPWTKLTASWGAIEPALALYPKAFKAKLVYWRIKEFSLTLLNGADLDSTAKSL